MSTIAQTVTTALNAAGYGSYNTFAQPIVDALIAREEEIAGRIISTAVADFEVDEEDVRAQFEGLGMSLPPLQADIAPADPSTAAEQRLAALEAFARQNGFRG